MTEKPVLVYLDNQDYSNMANLTRHINEPDLPFLLEALRELKASANVKFVFSAVSVAEALPMKAADVDLSKKQVKMLRELCEDHALVNYANLVAAELKNLHKGDSSSIRVLTGEFEWMPSILERQFNLPSNAKSIEEEANELLMKTCSTDPKMRLEALPLAMRLVREAHLTQRQGRIDRGDFSYVQRRFHNVLLRLAVGEASAAEKRSAILESWNDLEWIVGLYDKHPELVDWYRDVVRTPNASAAAALRKFVAAMEGQTIPEQWRNGGWEHMRDKFIVGTVCAMSRELGIPNDHFAIENIRRHCPGICAEAGVQFSFAWSYIAGGAKKEISNSAAADAMHAAYGPYVDIFRTDRSMTPHVTQSLEGSKTRVVGDRHKLIQAIQESLRERQVDS